MREYINDALVVALAVALAGYGWLINLIRNPEVAAALLSLLGWGLRTAYTEFRFRRRDQALREREERAGLSDGKDQGRNHEEED